MDLAKVISDIVDRKLRMIKLDPSKLIGTQSGYTLPQATETALGGIKAAAKTSAETSEVKIDASTGKLYVPGAGETANGLPAGGAAGQVLSKVDGTDYNAQWVDAPSGGTSNIITGYTYVSGDASSSLHAWKGNRFKPDIQSTIYALGFIGTLAAGATYQAAVVKYSGTTITSITKSASVTVSSSLSTVYTKCLWLFFDAPVVLSPGIDYGLVIGRTDSSDTYGLPILFTGGTDYSNSVPMTGLSHGNYMMIDKANPSVGDAVIVGNANSAGMWFLYKNG